MTKVQAIEKEVEPLSGKELVAFRRWFEELDAEAWNRQLEGDVHAGRLDALAEEALEASEAGECAELWTTRRRRLSFSSTRSRTELTEVETRK